MRARISALVVAIVFAGCSSGTHTVYVVRERPVPVPPPAAPPPVVFQPLEIALGRPSARSLPVQTNRAAYVAIFEITPREGVILVHPSTPRQTRMVLSGLSFVPVWWESQPGGGRANDARPPHPTRYIYALASERPLRLLDSAFVPGYLERVLGPGGLRAAAPQPAMRALARHFAAAAVSGRWAEDLYTLAPSTEASPRRVARIYCTGGTVYEVPEDIADRAWCPVQGPVPPQNTAGNAPPTQPATGPAPARPDSVVGPGGRLVNRRIGDALRRAVGHQESDPQPGDKDKAEKDKADKDKADKDKADKDKIAKDKADKDQAGKERADAEKADRDRAEKDKGEKEKRDQQQAEADRVAKDHADKEHAEKEQVERERAGKEKAEKDKSDKEKADKAAKEQGEREKADKEKADREAADAVAARESVEAERVRVEKEKAEKEKAEKEKAAKEKAEKEKAEKDQADKEKAEKAKAEKDQADKEKAEKAKAEKDQADREKADKEKAEKDKADKDKADKDGKRTGPPKAGPPTR